jgi:hypothetical protein
LVLEVLLDLEGNEDNLELEVEYRKKDTIN